MPGHYHSWSTKAADKIEDTGRHVVKKLQKWSKDDPSTWTDDALRIGGKALQGVGKVASLPGIKHGLSVLGAGGWAGGKVGGKVAEKLKIDPRLGRWVGGAAGDVLTGGAITKAGKVGRTALQIRKLNKKGAGLETLHALQAGKKSGYTFASGPKGAVKTQATMRDALTANKKSRKLLSQVEEHVDTQDALSIGKLPDHIKKLNLAKKFKTDKKFVKQLSGQQTKLRNFIDKTADKRGHTDLRKYKGYGKDDLITAPDGEKFKYKWKDGGFKWRSLTAEARSKLTRATGESADLTTITNVYKKHFNPKQAKEAAEIYVGTQQTVKKKIDDAINRFNKGKPEKDPTRLSLEHITDVKFYDRVKGDVPQFQGRGANELQNITVLDLPTNKRTGAYNKKLDHWKSVIQSVRTGRGFADYNKSVAQFIYEDIAGMVNDFKPKDWDKFLNQMLTRQGDTAYEVLLEMARKQK